jgi:hypothetical protein
MKMQMFAEKDGYMTGITKILAPNQGTILPECNNIRI